MDNKLPGSEMKKVEKKTRDKLKVKKTLIMRLCLLL